MAKTVRTTSKLKIVVFCSIAMKYPCCTMPVKTSTCKNRAPPKQLKPIVWKRTRILRLKSDDSVMAVENTRLDNSL